MTYDGQRDDWKGAFSEKETPRFSDVTRITHGSDRLEALEEMLLLLRLPMNKEVARS
jgi:hypothetical protein